MSSHNLKNEDNDHIAMDAILDALYRENAMVWPEIEAKLAEHPHPRLPDGINPHVLTRARRKLINNGSIIQVADTTRGGYNVDVIVRTDLKRRKTAVDRAAARKRLLQGRYLSWASASGKTPNLIGEGGERVVRASLRTPKVREVGYVPCHPTGGEVTRLFKQPVPVGPLDDGAFLTVLNEEMPVAMTIPIEVKNLRQWIYPSTQELYQLLHKCAEIQKLHPQQSLVPVLICRRAHVTTGWMAKSLGFMVISMLAQPILPRSEVSPEAIQEVNDELGYDLKQTDEPLDEVVNKLRYALPTIATRTATRWAANAPVLAPYFARLLDDTMPTHIRSKVLDDLRAEALKLPGVEGGW